MNERQHYALTHPLNNAQDPDAGANLKATRKHGAGWIVLSILAVDR